MRNHSNPLKLVKILADGHFHSGEELATQFGITRAGINRYIKILRGWGLSLSSIQGKGYCLDSPLDLLDIQKIHDYSLSHNRSLQCEATSKLTKYNLNSATAKMRQIELLPIIDSTNQYLLDRVNQLQSGDCCIAEFQSKARGRRGRQWFAPFGSNLYYSMYWRLEQGIAAAMGMSLVVGITVADTLNKLTGQNIKVKWPNDLYLNDKKLAGILVELTGKAGDMAHAIIGIGINIMMKNPDNSVVNQAWANLGKVDRNLLVANLIDALQIALTKFEQSGLAPFITDWNRLDNFANRKVKLLIGDEVVRGIAKGINDQGALLLEQDGSTKAYIGGEISLRSDS
ncbi:bifunctional biotin--[acetyl-CoA-carboxylase] ligase/biotin operon repressor BirA [Orbaceae bacterium ESL0721]|nr:bifunctional biotin--[acetyl-CoA-carboxylase] ligase/biotin operon repressor BirA [Orbaceae bacterium ESL0721]